MTRESGNQQARCQRSEVDPPDPFDTDAEGLSDLTEHLLGLNPNVADSNGQVRLVSWPFNILAHEFELEHRVIDSASMLDRRWS